MITYIYDDGGREVSGFKGTAGDCAVRAIAIITGKPYREIYDSINLLAQYEKITKKKKAKSNARTGVYKNTMKIYLASLGFIWKPTMTIGSGCKVHLNDGELPTGKIIVRLSKHFAAVIDGILHDTYDSSRDGTRCIYGYWTK